MRLAAVCGLLRGVDQHHLDAGIGRDIGDARPHHARADDADAFHRLIRDLRAVGAFFQRFFVDEKRADHGAGRGVHQHRGELPRLDLQRGVKGHQRAFIDRRKQRLGGRIDALRLAIDHGGGPHEGHEARRVIGRAAGHFIALGIPRLDQIGLFGGQNPFLGARQQRLGGDDLVDDARRFGLLRVAELAFQQEGRGHHGAEFAHKAGGAARAGEDADHDFRQADLGLGIIGGDDAVAGQRQFKADAKGGAGQRGHDGLATFEGFRVHARALDLAQHGMHLHHAIKDRLHPPGPHLRDDVEIHPAREILLGRRDDHTLHGSVRKGGVNMAVEQGKPLQRHDIHAFRGHIPGDGGDAICINGIGEIGHFVLLSGEGIAGASRPRTPAGYFHQVECRALARKAGACISAAPPRPCRHDR